MHWPNNLPIHRVDSKQALIVLRSGAQLSPVDFSRSALQDLSRSALALGVSAFDRYVHERVVKRIVRALRKKDLSRIQQDLVMPAVASLRVAQATVKARKASKPFRPANEIRKALQETLHRRPFQNWRELDYAFNLIGITNLETQLRARYGVNSLKPKHGQLNSIATRRNRITHEGDLVRHERGGKVRPNPIDPKIVREALDFLDTLVGHLEAVS
jgi:methylmalonyl-CoA mutase cobalamin-binding subunit